MPIKTYNVAPYYDDYNETKNYQRILFRPGVSVQARELTQLQTALQAQIDRFGRHIFKDGSPAIGGLASLDTGFAYVKCETTFTHYATATVANGGVTGLTITSGGTGTAMDSYGFTVIKNGGTRGGASYGGNVYTILGSQTSFKSFLA